MGAALVSPTILQDAKNTPAHSVSPWYPGRRIGRQGTLSRNGRPAFQIYFVLSFSLSTQIPAPARGVSRLKFPLQFDVMTYRLCACGGEKCAVATVHNVVTKMY